MKKRKSVKGIIDVNLIKPNLLKKEYLVAAINTYWTADLTYLKNIKCSNKKGKIKVFFMIDLGNGECISAKVLFENEKRFKENRGVSSLYIVKSVQQAINRYTINKQKHNLVIHTDRGPEFVSQLWKDLEIKNKRVKLSMSDKADPLCNSVSERFNRTFKNQLNNIYRLKQKYKSIIDIQRDVNKRIAEFNKEHKSKRNLNIGATEFRKRSEENTNLPILHKNKCNSKDTANVEQINKFRKDTIEVLGPEEWEQTELKKKFWNKINQIMEFLDSTNKGIEMSNEIAALSFHKIEQIHNALIKPKKKKKLTKALRVPVSETVFHAILRVPKLSGFQIIGYHRFRLCCILLYITGLRLNEVGKLTIQRIDDWIQKGVTTLYISKTNSEHVVVIASEHIELLKKYKYDIEIVFNAHSTIQHTQYTKNFIGWFNNYLQIFLTIIHTQNPNYVTEQEIQLLKSHSFRIARVYRLLGSGMPIQDVAQHIGHKNINTTQRYNRNNPFDAEFRKKLDQAELKAKMKD